MKRGVGMVGWIAGLALLFLPLHAAAGGKLPWEEYDKLIQTRMTVAAAGPDLFGEKRGQREKGPE